MTNITTTAPLVRPIGRILLLLAILFLLPGIWITWPEGAVQEWPRPPGLKTIAFDPHGALVQQEGATLKWYDPTSTSLVVNEAGIMARPFVIAPLTAYGEITRFAISPDGQWVATGTTSGTLTLWTGSPTWRAVETLQLTPPGGGDASVSTLSFSADGRSLCWVASSRTANGAKTISIRVWDRVTRQDRFMFTQTIKDETAAYDYWGAHLSPDGQQIMLIGRAIEVRRVDDQRLIYRIVRDPGSSESFARVAVSPDQQWLASGGQGQVTIRRFRDGAVVQVLKGPPNGDHLVAFSPDSRYLAVGANTTSSGFLPIFRDWEPITLWRVADWRVVQTFQGHIEGALGWPIVLPATTWLPMGRHQVIAPFDSGGSPRTTRSSHPSSSAAGWRCCSELLGARSGSGGDFGHRAGGLQTAPTFMANRWHDPPLCNGRFMAGEHAPRGEAMAVAGWWRGVAPTFVGLRCSHSRGITDERRDARSCISTPSRLRANGCLW